MKQTPRGALFLAIAMLAAIVAVDACSSSQPGDEPDAPPPRPGGETGDIGPPTAATDAASSPSPIDAAAIDALSSPIDASSPACVTPIPDDPMRAQRLACAFTAGARVADTLGLDDETRRSFPIEHIVVIMKENRSFDHLFGGLRKLQPEAEVFPPTFFNRDAHGAIVKPFRLNTTCVRRDPDHQWQPMHAQVNGGAMDGYVTSAAHASNNDGHYAIGYYDQQDLPFYYFLASTYALADHYFASVNSGTFPNRDYLLLGTSDKVHSTQFNVWPDPSLPTILDRLDDAGVSWGVYADEHPFEECLNDPRNNWEKLNPWRPVRALIDDFARGTVPSVVFVDSIENIEDEHPTADVQVGEAWTKRIYDAAVTSPVWSKTVLLLTYDEAGGFFDHVPPPRACLARPEDTDFFDTGTRVPLIAISPWARRHFVSKVPREHTSITRFIEAVHDLPALTARDANSDALLDMFEFGCPPGPVPVAPASGTGGCRGPLLAVSKTSYAPGEPIELTFQNGPGHPRDWIGVYPAGQGPRVGSTIWGYVGGGGHTARSGPTDGTIVLGPGSQNSAGEWPLARGHWVAYFLDNDGYGKLASVNFEVR